MSHSAGQCTGWTKVYRGGQCRVCWVAKNPATMYRGSGTCGVVADPSRTPAPYPDVTERRVSLPVLLFSAQPCVHLGEALPNQTCGCKEKLRACDIHGICTTGHARPPHHCCESCPDFRTTDDPTDTDRRHLLYYVYPVAGVPGNALWKRNLDQLKRRLSLFNGRRVIAISTGSQRHKLDTPESVVEYFGKDSADFLFVPHAKKLGEVTAFVPLWERVKQFTSPHDFTFYGHSKGVTKPVNAGISVHRWADLMYAANLDRWSEVREELRTHPITGAFRKLGRCFGGRANWHYTGTFYWCRNADVFSRNWRNIWQNYGGTELWPGTMWDYASSGCHFYDGIGFSMYSIAEVTRAEDAIQSVPIWKERNVGDPEKLKELQNVVATLPDPPASLSGRGVVTFTSNKYNPGTYVLIRMLRHFGYDGLVQVWARPNDPVPEAIRQMRNVECREIIDPASTDYQMYQRTWVLLNCGLKEVFLIGSDAYPVDNITPWFGDLEAWGNVLWEDHTSGDKFAPEVYGLPESCRATTFTPQGDTKLLDMSRMWKVVSLVHHLNLNGAYYHPWGIGDQTCWRAALELLGTDIARYSANRVDASIPVVFLHQGRDGVTPGIVHRTGCKMAYQGDFVHPPVQIDNLPYEELAWSYYEEYHQWKT